MKMSNGFVVVKSLVCQVITIPLLSLSFLLWLTVICYALDQEGCLTCHQYPGLVTLEKTLKSEGKEAKDGHRYLLQVTTTLDRSEDFKVLHIDEKRYTQSEHGKLLCRQCHTTVWKIPHVGNTTIDCTSKCHKEDAEKILADKDYIANIHKKEQSYIVRLMDKSSCRVCHALYPHSEDEVVRTLLNMHTGFMLCEVCHIKRDKFEQLTYEWYESENARFVGEPFGSYYNPQTEKSHKGDKHFITRLAVFTSKDKVKRSLMNSWDIGESKKYLRQEAGLNAEAKKEKMTFFHRDIDKKELSIACEECHATNGILDLKKLGFAEMKISHLVNLNIKGLVTKYKEFYFPHLLKFDN